jgi:hypothetical protein
MRWFPSEQLSMMMKNPTIKKLESYPNDFSLKIVSLDIYHYDSNLLHSNRLITHTQNRFKAIFMPVLLRIFIGNPIIDDRGVTLRGYPVVLAFPR